MGGKEDGKAREGEKKDCRKEKRRKGRTEKRPKKRGSTKTGDRDEVFREAGRGGGKDQSMQ